MKKIVRSRIDYLAHRPALVQAHDTSRAYGEIVRRHLAPEDGVGEADFFVNEKRFYLLARLIERHLGRMPGRILNVACGPFAFEYFCRLDGCEIVSFDRDARLSGVFRELRARDLIAPARFFVGEAGRCALDRPFDLVLVNDLFYSKTVEFSAVLGELAGLVAPDGYLYFDVPERRAGPLWALAGRAGKFRRYDPGEIGDHLARRRFTIVASAPSMGITGGFDERLRRALWSIAGIANNTAILARAAG